MRQLLSAAFLALVPLTACATSPQPLVSPSISAGGLSCFTIADIKPPAPHERTPSCDQLCLDLSASCTGVTSTVNPPYTCATPAAYATCRCCKVAQ